MIPAPRLIKCGCGTEGSRFSSVGIWSIAVASWWFGVDTQLDASGLNQIVVKSFDKSFWSANTGPCVVPESRNQPGSIFRKEQVRKDAVLRSHVSRSPAEGLLGAGGHQYVVPVPVERHLGCVIKDDVGTSVQIATTTGQEELDEPVHHGLLVREDRLVGLVEGGVGLEDRRDRVGVWSIRSSRSRSSRRPSRPDLPVSPLLGHHHQPIKHHGTAGPIPLGLGPREGRASVH